mgnify:CR=1 FL=1
MWYNVLVLRYNVLLLRPRGSCESTLIWCVVRNRHETMLFFWTNTIEYIFNWWQFNLFWWACVAIEEAHHLRLPSGQPASHSPNQPRQRQHTPLSQPAQAAHSHPGSQPANQSGNHANLTKMWIEKTRTKLIRNIIPRAITRKRNTLFAVSRCHTHLLRLIELMPCVHSELTIILVELFLCYSHRQACEGVDSLLPELLFQDLHLETVRQHHISHCFRNYISFVNGVIIWLVIQVSLLSCFLKAILSVQYSQEAL